MTQPSCKDLIHIKFNEILASYIVADRYFTEHYNDLETREDNRPDVICPTYESFYDYVGQTALSWDYVKPNTFTDQEEGYWRLQLSYGGPSDEFRVFTYPDDETKIHKVFYHYMDWFDGAKIEVPDIGKNEPIFKALDDFIHLSVFA